MPSHARAPDPAIQSDEELVLLATAGDHRALVELLRRHQTWIFNLALNMLQSRADAEDATQEVLLNEYFRRVEETGEELVVTDKNEPVLRIVPIPKRVPMATLFADVRGRVVYHEDPLAPTTTEWPET